VNLEIWIQITSKTPHFGHIGIFDDRYRLVDFVPGKGKCGNLFINTYRDSDFIPSTTFKLSTLIVSNDAIIQVLNPCISTMVKVEMITSPSLPLLSLNATRTGTRAANAIGTDERGTLKYNGRSLQRLSVIECLLSTPHFDAFLIS
jgi:hypothetical protein